MPGNNATAAIALMDCIEKYPEFQFLGHELPHVREWKQLREMLGRREDLTLPKPMHVYLTDKSDKAIVVGDPQQGWDEESDNAHNCDAAHCGQAHVLARLPFTDERTSVAPSGEKMLTVLRGLLEYVDGETCLHETTHRGGAIWTICDDCGAKWADDQGGFKPHQDEPAVEAARDLVNAVDNAARLSPKTMGRIARGVNKFLSDPATVVEDASLEVTNSLCAMLQQRAKMGREKYGVTLDRDDMTPAQWLQHLIEELLDGAGYALAAKRMIESGEVVKTVSGGEAIRFAEVTTVAPDTLERLLMGRASEGDQMVAHNALVALLARSHG